MTIAAFETWIRNAANRVGIDIHRYRHDQSEFGRLAAMLASHNVDLVLDVGANIGQFSQSLRKASYQGRIVSFEPLLVAHAQLKVASRSDARWEVAPRVAIGDHEGEIEMHVAANSFSSSALEMLDRHKKAAPGSTYVGSERVKLMKLDTLALDYIKPEDKIFLKIDTQGYEDRVLNGATNLLERICGMQLELSFLPLYEGQHLFDALVARVQSLGFSIWAIWPGICDATSGRMLQVDATFFKG